MGGLAATRSHCRRSAWQEGQEGVALALATWAPCPAGETEVPLLPRSGADSPDLGLERGESSSSVAEISEPGPPLSTTRQRRET
jgi:hypothetical protein